MWINHVFLVWGILANLSSGRGFHFIGKIMQVMCKILGIGQRFHVSYHSQFAGTVLSVTEYSSFDLMTGRIILSLVFHNERLVGSRQQGISVP